MPESIGFYFGACCGICRIIFYNLCPCGRRQQAYKPSYNVICLGLSGTGKTTALATYCGESATDVEPTVGFNMKDIILETCVIHVKEIGGGPKVRPYWRNYLSDGFQGIIFTLDSTASGDDLNMTISELQKLLTNPQVEQLPCLILATHQDKSNALQTDDVISTFQIEELCGGRPWAIHTCVSSDDASVKIGFEKLASLLWQQDQTDVSQDNP